MTKHSSTSRSKKVGTRLLPSLTSLPLLNSFILFIFCVFFFFLSQLCFVLWVEVYFYSLLLVFSYYCLSLENNYQALINRTSRAPLQCTSSTNYLCRSLLEETAPTLCSCCGAEPLISPAAPHPASLQFCSDCICSATLPCETHRLSFPLYFTFFF